MPRPSDREVHVWSTTLILPDEDRPRAVATLSPDERDRATAFLRDVDRWRFVAARSWLRRVLARYVDVSPDRLAFGEGLHGKPTLPGAGGLIDFNLSHAGNHAILAVSLGFPVGIDLEEVGPVAHGVAERSLSRDEVAALHRLPEAERDAAVLRAWTRKEAYLKALGSGLATPLDGFTVSLGPDAPAHLLSVAGDPDEAARWQIVALAPGAGLIAAVAARRLGWHVVIKP